MKNSRRSFLSMLAALPLTRRTPQSRMLDDFNRTSVLLDRACSTTVFQAVMVDIDQARFDAHHKAVADRVQVLLAQNLREYRENRTT